MTSTPSTIAPALRAPRRARHVARGERIRFVDLLRSEWIKLASVPTTWLSLGGIFAAGVGGAVFLGLMLEATGVPSVPSLEETMMDVTMAMTIIGQIVAGIVGVICVSSEYSAGTIQSALLATPTRLRVLSAKAVLMFSVLTATGLVTVLTAWGVTYPMYAEFGLEAPIAGYGVATSLLGSAAYLGFCAVFGLGLGTLVRSATTGAILVFFATLLGPVLSSLIPEGPASKIVRFMLIGNAGDSMSRTLLPDAPFLTFDGYISPPAGWLLVAGWAMLALAAGAIALQKRDA